MLCPLTLPVQPLSLSFPPPLNCRTVSVKTTFIKALSLKTFVYLFLFVSAGLRLCTISPEWEVFFFFSFCCSLLPFCFFRSTSYLTVPDSFCVELEYVTHKLCSLFFVYTLILQSITLLHPIH